MELLLTFKNGFTLHHDRGRLFDLRLKERSVLGPFILRWAYGGSPQKKRGFSSSERDVTDLQLKREVGEAHLEFPILAGAHPGVTFRECAAGLEVTQWLRLEASEQTVPAFAFELATIDLKGSLVDGLGVQPDWRFFPTGYNSFTPVSARDSRTEVGAPPFPTAAIFNQHYESTYYNKRHALSSPWMAMMGRRGDARGLLLGYVSAHIGLGEVALRRGGSPVIEARQEFSGKQLIGGETLQGEPLWVAFSDDGDQLLTCWTREVAQRMRARVPAPPVPSGWCSWYYYYTGVTGPEVNKNLDALAQQRDRLPIAYVQLDDGYQTHVGDWLSINRKFPEGLEALAHSIKARGFLPGIWTAPFFVQRGAAIYRHHPDWLVKDDAGKPIWMGYLPTWGILDGHLYGLDPSHPEVLNYLTEVYTTLVGYGYEYFKIDFLFAGLKPGLHFNPRLSHVEAYRSGLMRIREAIGERFLLGCGAPLLPSIGMVDGMRISTDVKEAWRDPIIGMLSRGAGHPSAELSLLNCLTRSHMHNLFWFNDPDCLLVRENRSRLTLPEVRTLVTVLSLTGGMLFLSDDMDALSISRRELAELALPPAGAPAVALGLRHESRPCRFVRRQESPEGGEEALAAWINWEDRAVEQSVSASTFGLPDGAYHVYEYWSKVYRLLEPGGAFTTQLEPHGTALMLFRPACPHPKLITATHHLGQTTVLLKAASFDQGQHLSIRLKAEARREGEILIAVPPRFEWVDASTRGCIQVTGTRHEVGLVALATPLWGEADLTVSFREKSPS